METTRLTYEDKRFILIELFRSGCQGCFVYNGTNVFLALYRSNYLWYLWKQSKIANSMKNQYLAHSIDYENNFPMTMRMRNVIYFQAFFESIDIFQETLKIFSKDKHVKFDITRIMHHILTFTAALLSHNPFYSIDFTSIIGLTLSTNQIVGLGFNFHPILKRIYKIHKIKKIENENEDEDENEDEKKIIYVNNKPYPLIIKLNLYFVLVGQLLIRFPLTSTYAAALLKFALFDNFRNTNNEANSIVVKQNGWHLYYRIISGLIGGMVCFQTLLEIDWLEWTLRELGWWHDKPSKRKYYATALSAVSVGSSFALLTYFAQRK